MLCLIISDVSTCPRLMSAFGESSNFHRMAEMGAFRPFGEASDPLKLTKTRKQTFRPRIDFHFLQISNAAFPTNPTNRTQ